MLKSLTKIIFLGKKEKFMSTFYKFIIAAFFIAIATGYSHAHELELNNQTPDSIEPQHLVAPELRVTIKTIPKFTGISPINTNINPEIDFTDSENPVSDSSQYTSLLKNWEDLKKKSIEDLYKTHGFNREVKRRIYYYSKESKEDFLKYLSRAGRYIEKMAEIFIERNLPPELVFLPLIESGFKLNAYSPKRAAGPWQFIPGTAKKYGLKIDWWVDERRDPIKSTIAAAEYLSDLYGIFSSWNLALAAYNAGEGRILKALKRIKSNDFWVLRKTRYIKKETKNYVPSYIAATAIALHPESFGFENVAYHSPLEYDEVEINSPMDLAVVAEFTDSDITEIKELNPELRRWCTPPNVSNYTLKIPAGTKEIFLSRLLNAEDDELFFVKFYTVKKGDTVGKLARQFGVPAKAIIDVNSLGRRAMIIAGSKILIPYKRTVEVKEESKGSNRIKPILKKNPSIKSSRKTSI